MVDVFISIFIYFVYLVVGVVIVLKRNTLGESAAKILTNTINQSVFSRIFKFRKISISSMWFRRFYLLFGIFLLIYGLIKLIKIIR